ncbi:hypothetical protein LX32DRAFT_262901 [Colletotrichum zoysiae]|uniref:Uncharacterized protein n=1 Tax=Colletotrichum zoysiae TaxID=1216348 RepID=A0AAD9M3F0_9PEZI|nr:hypothetical protein LX32DRAFT_262901 [Colletotrichum zoysiae]
MSNKRQHLILGCAETVLQWMLILSSQTLFLGAGDIGCFRHLDSLSTTYAGNLAERSKAPDSRDEVPPYDLPHSGGVFWSRKRREFESHSCHRYFFLLQACVAASGFLGERENACLLWSACRARRWTNDKRLLVGCCCWLRSFLILFNLVSGHGCSHFVSRRAAARQSNHAVTSETAAPAAKDGVAKSI